MNVRCVLVQNQNGPSDGLICKFVMIHIKPWCFVVPLVIIDIHQSGFIESDSTTLILPTKIKSSLQRHVPLYPGRAYLHSNLVLLIPFGHIRSANGRKETNSKTKWMFDEEEHIVFITSQHMLDRSLSAMFWVTETRCSSSRSLTLLPTRHCKSQLNSSKSATSCLDPASAQSTGTATAPSSLFVPWSCPCCPPRL